LDRNLLLAFALSFLVLTTWTLWQSKQRANDFPEGISESPIEQQTPTAGESPLKSVPNSKASEIAPPVAKSAAGEQVRPAPRTIEVSTPFFTVELSTRGGGLSRWTLEQFRDASLPEHPKVELTTLEAGEIALATPFRELGLGDLSEADFQVEQPSPHDVVFVHRGGGITVRKAYSFDQESYDFHLELRVENGSQQTISPTFELAWPTRERSTQDFADHALLVLADGSVQRVRLTELGSAGFFSRFLGGVPETGPIVHTGEIDWAGAETRYFVSVFLPDVPREAQARFEVLEPSKAGAAVLSFRPETIPPGQSFQREYRAYLGPKESDRLAAAGPSLERTIDRGWSWVAPLTAAFSWMLRASYSVIPNYGVAIILITVLVRLAMAPLMTKQMQSMRRLGELQPRMKEIQERFADDRQRQSEEMMKLYRQSGVNPLGGCFPMLLQFPVFIGLYYALQSSIDLRQAPFFLWIRDLSAPETLFLIPGLGIPVRVLPLLMGASMVFQSKLTPTSVDPAQARMMMTVMPVMFTVLFYQFPSGLVLYWFVSNLLGIGQQLWVNRGRAKAPAPAK
jgi:YidC/Oxa1 family membrane protein insertase